MSEGVDSRREWSRKERKGEDVESILEVVEEEEKRLRLGN